MNQQKIEEMDTAEMMCELKKRGYVVLEKERFIAMIRFLEKT